MSWEKPPAERDAGKSALAERIGGNLRDIVPEAETAAQQAWDDLSSLSMKQSTPRIRSKFAKTLSHGFNQEEFENWCASQIPQARAAYEQASAYYAMMAMALSAFEEAAQNADQAIVFLENRAKAFDEAIALERQNRYPSKPLIDSKRDRSVRCRAAAAKLKQLKQNAADPA